MSRTSGYPRTRTGPSRPYPHSNTLPARYCPIPQRLIHDLHDTPLAIGLYALVGRLYLVAQAPVALSRSDVIRYDPALKTGAVKRAFARLIARGWLIEDTGQVKHGYTPTWGSVGGTQLRWLIGEPCMGRPRHIARLALDLTLLDVCMGKLTPHATRAATVTRYLTAPALSLADIGAYALTLAGLPCSTPGLVALGVVRNNQALPVPEPSHLLAVLSQRTLLPDDAADLNAVELSSAGARQLGMATVTPAPGDRATPQPLFFVPPSQIGILAPRQIGSVIGCDEHDHAVNLAAVSAETPVDQAGAGITWDDQKANETRIPPPSRSRPHQGGGSSVRVQKLSGRRHTEQVPDTEATRRLRELHVRPAALIRHANTALAVINAAIRDAEARPYVQDRAAWVVSLLDDATQHDHVITPSRQAAHNEWVKTGGWDEATCAAFQAEHASLPPQEELDSEVAQREVAGEPLTPLIDEQIGAVPAERLAHHVRAELTARCGDRTLRRLIDSLGMRETDDAVMVTCASARDVTVVHQQLYSMLVVVLRQCGRLQQVSVRAGDIPAPPQASREPNDGRPPWIPAEHWYRCSKLFRAALYGATWDGDDVRCTSPDLDQLVRVRHRAELDALRQALATPEYHRLEDKEF